MHIVRREISGFTIIELLVVVSIIAVLAALLLPAIGMVRSSAQSAACASVHRQLGIALQGYLADNDNMVPPASAPPPWNNSASTSKSWRMFLSPYVEKDTTGTNDWELKSTSCPVMYQRNANWRNRTNGPAGTTGQWDGGISMNPRLELPIRSTPSLDYFWSAAPYTNFIGGISISKVTHVSRRAFLLDGNSWGTATVSGSGPYTFGNHPGSVPNPDGTLSQWDATRHRRFGNVLFLDGHVQSLSATDAAAAIGNPALVP